MKLEDLQFGLKWVSIGMRLGIAALIGTIAAAILADIGGQKFWVLVLVLMLLCAVAGTLATILGAANLRKVNRNYRLAFWAVLAVVVLSFSIGALEDVRAVLRNGMAAAVAYNIIQGTNELLKQRGCDELVRWGRWAARWMVAVAVVSILYLLFEAVNSSELQAICLVVGVILSVLFLIFYIEFLKDASAEVSAWETLPGGGRAPTGGPGVAEVFAPLSAVSGAAEGILPAKKAACKSFDLQAAFASDGI